MEKYLIHWFPFCSGGLCDRILGMSGNVCIAKLLNRKLLLRWDNADLKPNVLIPPEYNFYTYNPPFRHINMHNIESMDYFKNTDIIRDWGDDNIMIWSNINLYNYILQNPHFVEVDKQHRVQNFSDAIREVLSKYLQLNSKLFTSYKKYDVGIHIRTGDKQIYNKENEEFYRDYITDIFKKIKVEPDQTVFISSDCLLTFKIASDFFDKFDYNEGEIVHTANEITDDGVYKVLLDLLTLCNCTSTLYLGWNSNFSRIAALYDINRKFICYEYQNDPGVVKEISPDVLFEYHSYGKYT